jgi:hypothetical protein
MLHPALLDFGEPWNYVSALYTESSGNGGSNPTAVGNGIRLATGVSAGGYSTTQRISEIQAVAGKRLLVAGRFQLNNLTNSNLWLGAWETNGNPLGSLPLNGVFIQKPATSPSVIRGRRRMFDGTTQYDDTTANLLTPTANTFVDVAVLILGTSSVQFLVLRSDGAWTEAIISSSIPTVILRPAVAVQLSVAGASGINCDVRSFFVHEEI